MFNNLNLFTASSLKLLYALASDPMRSFYQREAAGEARVSVGSANRILRGLVDRGLIDREKKGKIYLYRFNIDNPVSRHLKVLFNIMEVEKFVDKLQNFTTRVILFGSCAEGRDARESDIDLLILTNEKKAVSEIIGQHTSKRRLAPIIVNANDFTKLRNDDRTLYDEILRGVTLWERD
jgi:predicted nucleotidyltransferase